MLSRAFMRWIVVPLVLLFLVDPGMTDVLNGNPNNYLGLLRSLTAGDTLLLEPGIYDDPSDVPGLPFFNIHGEPDRPIVVMGAKPDDPPTFLGRSTHNTVRFNNASYIEIRNIRIDGRDLGGDGVKAQGISHHIILENLLIKGVGSDQQIVGINTKAPAWNWIVRNCVILDAGTGIYLGSSNGTNPFVNGVIEYNLILNTIGYNMQIKHQIDRPVIEGMPRVGITMIRHNVFSKAENGATGGNARPNLLVGHWPLSGDGADDVYQIYGNLFYQNPTEALFQGEGNIALHHNLLINDDGPAVHIQPHNDVPKMIRVFHNTIVASSTGIKVTGGASGYQQKVIGNAIFAATPIQAADQEANVTDAYEAAVNYLTNPKGALGELDLYPKPGMLTGSAISTDEINGFIDWDRDFNGAKHKPTYRGAYAGEGENPGWMPQLEIKSLTTKDTIPPAAVMDLGFIEQTDTSVMLSWTAPGDDEHDGGPVYMYDLRYSEQPIGNDLVKWFNTATKVSIMKRPEVPGSQEIVVIVNLDPGREYSFLMRSIDDVANISEFSNPARLTPVHIQEESKEPHKFILLQNFPNPFNPQTTIRYKIGGPAHNSTGVLLQIFDLLGQKIRSLVNAVMSPGSYEVTWDGRDDLGRQLPSGIYIYQFKSDSFVASRKLLLLR